MGDLGAAQDQELNVIVQGTRKWRKLENHWHRLSTDQKHLCPWEVSVRSREPERGAAAFPREQHVRGPAVREGRSLCCPALRASRKMKTRRKEPEAIRQQKTLHVCGHSPSRISGTGGVTLDERDQLRGAGWKMQPDRLK